ncbi:MAG: hypothetical protein GBAus27B_000271 [Mycoplasmataceae bacterium]|nr:MAG: hypothetical protein GBAus27B_000271 [Mycoplasmataceae bacterium]
MNEILIITLIFGAGYYLLIHQKPSNNNPITRSQFTQTNPIVNSVNHDEKSLERTLDTLIHNIDQLNQQIQ